MISIDLAGVSDEHLWQLACDGDRDAFGRIVERYQTLICSIAYSACGVLGASEDMAQETFITAWHRLKDLRDPGKLRQWLCGIVRNIAASTVRRDQRRGGAPECLEVTEVEPAIETDPAAQAISREEETLLWRTLAGMPASYREPLVLFYREEKSVDQVAQQLDLSRDTVKQRLCRGRAMLREEVAVLVESTLSRTRPGTAFTVGVLVALPMVAASNASAAAAAGAAGKTSATAAGKGFFTKLGLGAFTGAFIGLVVAFLGSKAAALTTRSERERKYVRRYSALMTGYCFAMSIGLVAVLSFAGRRYTASALGILVGVLTWVAVLVVGMVLMCQRLNRAVNRIRIETGTADEVHATV